MVSLDEVAVAGAVAGRDGDCRYAFNVAMMRDSETAINGLGDGHLFQEVAQLVKCYVLHDYVFVPFELVGLSSRSGSDETGPHWFRTSSAVVLILWNEP